jgi:RNA-binding protein 25
MPNINFNAPVIRLGSSAPQRSGALDSSVGRRESAATPRRGIGMDMGSRDADGQKGLREQQLIAPTREEIARTIFVGNIPDGVGGDDGMERVLATAGNLRKWIRATDANNKPQTFGFAEYEDAEGLETAAEIFKDVQLPTKRQSPNKAEENGDAEVEKTKLMVMIDDASIKYAEEWRRKRKDDEATTQFRMDTAKQALDSVVASLFNPPFPLPVDHSRDAVMQDAPMPEGDGIEVVNIAFTADDELADIPAEMRETVAAEIAAFRDRSIRRDQERLRREEEIEAEERRRSGRRSPPPSAPTGPGGTGGANGVPLGPRADRGVQGAPSGPKGSQFPRDYQSGVNFVNGSTLNNGVYINREDDDDPASDEELERRRKKKHDEVLDEAYRKRLAQWQRTENRSTAALERAAGRMKHEEAGKERESESQAKYLAEFDDDAESSKKLLPYFRDRPEWLRERQIIKDREARDDARDRMDEQRELASQHKEKKEIAREAADSFLEQQAEELAQPRQPERFKLSLGAATKKMEQATAAPRRTVADVENLLEDEELQDTPTTKKRTLIPINFDAAVRANLTQEEVAEAQKDLAKEIPGDKEGLWKWPISWDHLQHKDIDANIRPWAEKKVLEIMGLQEDLLVDAIVEHLRSRGAPQDLVENLEVVSITLCF